MTVGPNHARCGRRTAASRRLAAPGQSETSRTVAERFACRPCQTCSFEVDEQLKRMSESRQSHFKKNVLLSAFNSAIIGHTVSLLDRELVGRDPGNRSTSDLEIVTVAFSNSMGSMAHKVGEQSLKHDIESLLLPCHWHSWSQAVRPTTHSRAGPPSLTLVGFTRQLADDSRSRARAISAPPSSRGYKEATISDFCLVISMLGA